MNVRYDYYTQNEDVAMEAMTLAVKYCPKKESVSLSYDADDEVWNISGTVDHKNVELLFDVFDDNFSEDRYSF